MPDPRLAAYNLGHAVWSVRYGMLFVWKFHAYYRTFASSEDPATLLVDHLNCLRIDVGNNRTLLSKSSGQSLQTSVTRLDQTLRKVIRAYRRNAQSCQGSRFGEGPPPGSEQWQELLRLSEHAFDDRPRLECWRALGAHVGHCRVAVLHDEDTGVFLRINELLTCAATMPALLRERLPILRQCAERMAEAPASPGAVLHILEDVAGITDDLAAKTIELLRDVRSAQQTFAEVPRKVRKRVSSMPDDVSAEQVASMSYPEVAVLQNQIVGGPAIDATDVHGLLRQVARDTHQLVQLVKAARMPEPFRSRMTLLERWTYLVEHDERAPTAVQKDSGSGEPDVPRISVKASAMKALTQFDHSLQQEMQDHLSLVELLLSTGLGNYQAILNGKAFEVSTNQYLLLQVLYRAGGNIVSSSKLKKVGSSARAVYAVVSSLPKPLQDIIGSQSGRGGGYRLRLD